MADMILHHYAGSPFAEKIRAVFGYKQMSWASVETSMIMPRPDLMPLSGGYRRVPVAQVGADVFCDTHVVTEYIEHAHPLRALVPEGCDWAVRALTARADTHLFQVVVALCFQPSALAALVASMGEEMMAKFAADRAQLVEGSAGVSSLAPDVAATYFHDEMAHLEAQLTADDWLFAGEPTLVDFAVYHGLWMLSNNAAVAPMLTPYAAVRGWMQRMAGLGHGRREEMAPEDALAIAREASPMTLEIASGHLPEGVDVGMNVNVTPVDYGLVPVGGTLDYCTAHACGIRREDPAVGEVRVHFPRSGFRIDCA